MKLFTSALILFALGATIHGQDQVTPAPSSELELTPSDLDGGWLQAGPDGLSQTLRRHSLYVTPDGNTVGRVSLINPVTHQLVPADGVFLTLVDAQGVPQYQAPVDPTGMFRLRNVPPGIWNVIASGPRAFATFAVDVVAVEAYNPNEVLGFEIAAVPALEFPALSLLFDKSRARQLKPATSWSVVEADDADNTKAVARGKQLVIGELDHRATTIAHHIIYTNVDGQLSGRMRMLHPETGQSVIPRDCTVYLCQGGEILLEAKTDKLGIFQFPHVAPGIYALIAEGESGFMAIAVDIQQVAPAEDDVEKVAFFQGNGSDLTLDGALINPNAIPTAANAFGTGQGDGQTPPTPPAPAPGGGAFPGGSGGFGGGSAGGALGGDALAGLLLGGAAAAAALLSNDDDNPVSPAAP